MSMGQTAPESDERLPFGISPSSAPVVVVGEQTFTDMTACWCGLDIPSWVLGQLGWKHRSDTHPSPIMDRVGRLSVHMTGVQVQR